MRILLISMLFLGCISFITSCKTAEGGQMNGKCKTEGTVTDLTGLDGCGLVIDLDDGTRLEVASLPEGAFELKAGQRVSLNYKKNRQMASICMAGEIVDVTCLSLITAAPDKPSECENMPKDPMSVSWMLKVIEKGDFDEILATRIEGAPVYFFHVTKCCDFQSFLYDCKGNKLCTDGGISGGDCQTAYKPFDVSKMKRIWTSPKE